MWLTDDDGAGVRTPVLYNVLGRLPHDQDHGGGRGTDDRVRGTRLRHPGGRRDRHAASARLQSAPQVSAPHHQQLCRGVNTEQNISQVHNLILKTCSVLNQLHF